MKADFYQPQVHKLLQMLQAEKGDEAEDVARLDCRDFLDENMLAKEKAMFRRQPLIIGHSSEIPQPGDFVVRELDNRSWLLVRGKDGVARAFLNYCQHRGTKLEQQEKGQCRHRFSCPYHAWTYNSEGGLVGVPRADLFPGLDKSSKGLRAGKLEEQYGLLWLTQDVQASEYHNVESFLAGLGEEFEALGMDKMHLYFDKTRPLKANWKFPLFAFLESYHLAVLHKESIADFFIENIAHTERLGKHIRSFVPRKNAMELAEVDLSKVTLADYVTPTNIVFPNICMIGHPTSLSILIMLPGDTPQTSSWRHMLLTPNEPTTEKERAHYDKSIAVLDGMTYKNEDFWVSEQIQEGISAGAIDEMLLSTNENLIKEFSEQVKGEL